MPATSEGSFFNEKKYVDSSGFLCGGFLKALILVMKLQNKNHTEAEHEALLKNNNFARLSKGGTKANI